MRERREDIPTLLEFLVRRHNVDMNRRSRGVDNAAMKALMRMPWKGNIRELDNVIEHAMIVGDGEWITTEDLPSRLSGAVHFYERGHIRNVLQRCEGDKKKASEALGISLSSLYRKIEKLGL